MSPVFGFRKYSVELLFMMFDSIMKGLIFQAMVRFGSLHNAHQKHISRSFLKNSERVPTFGSLLPSQTQKTEVDSSQETD